MKSIISISLILIAAIALRIYLIIRDSVPFAYDMGRDLLWAKDIGFYQIPTLIGPAASIWGVFYGPAWFYMLSIPLLIFGGNPLSAVFFTLLAVVGTSLLSIILLYKYLPKIYLAAFFIVSLFSFTLINLSIFAFPANLLPLISFLVVFFCFLAVIRTPFFIALGFFFSSLMFHFGPPAGVVYFFVPIFVFFYFKLYRRKAVFKIVAASIIAYVLPFIPQIIFELRNNFIQAKSFAEYLSGNNPSLSGQLPFFGRLENRAKTFIDFFSALFSGESNYLLMLLGVTFLIGIYKFFKRKSNTNVQILFAINCSILILTFIVFTIFLNVEIKRWYLYAIAIPSVFLLTTAIYSLKLSKIPLIIFLATFLIANISPFFKQEKILSAMNDPAYLSNQLRTIELIYGDSRQNPYSVYVYTPSIYDLNFQYLFWWQGIQRGRGLPQEFAYLPNEPSYVRNKKVYSESPKQTKINYLIIENGNENKHYTSAEWLKQFDSQKIIWERKINEAFIIQKRQITKNNFR